MTLRKNKQRHPLNRRIDQLAEVTLLSSEYHVSLIQIFVQSILEMYNEQPEKYGIPTYVALENGENLLIFPRPDKEYKVEVQGIILIVQ